MAKCEFVDGCPFFNDTMAEQRALADLYKQTLCRQDPTGCARYIVRTRLGKEAVPPDLYPNDLERADNLLRA